MMNESGEEVWEDPAGEALQAYTGGKEGEQETLLSLQSSRYMIILAREPSVAWDISRPVLNISAVLPSFSIKILRQIGQRAYHL